MLSIGVLGPLVINGGNHGKFPKKARALIAYLACQHGETVARNKLADLLWPYQGSEQARHSLRNCSLEVRKSLGPALTHCFSTTFSTCQLVDYQSDLEMLEAGANTDDFQGHLYRGPFLTTLDINSEPWEDWVTSESGLSHAGRPFMASPRRTSPDERRQRASCHDRQTARDTRSDLRAGPPIGHYRVQTGRAEQRGSPGLPCL